MMSSITLKNDFWYQFNLHIHVYNVHTVIHCKEKFGDNKEIIRSRNSQKDRQCHDQKKKDTKDKQWSTKHYTEHKSLSNMNHTMTGSELMCYKRVPVVSLLWQVMNEEGRVPVVSLLWASCGFWLSLCYLQTFLCSVLLYVHYIHVYAN
jgi:hypothetical protein